MKSYKVTTRDGLRELFKRLEKYLTKQEGLFEKERVNLLITVDGLTKKKTSEQHRYYWGHICSPISKALEEYWGYRPTLEETHEFLKINFLKVDEVVMPNGHVYVRAPSIADSAKLDRDVMMAFIDGCIQFARDELNLDLSLI